MRFEYRTHGTCSQLISFDIDGDVVRDVRFTGGCNGNLQAVSRLTDGMTASQIISKLSGIRCGTKPTSCPDQLSKAVAAALEASRSGQSAGS